MAGISEQQRAASIRAWINDPQCIFADVPAGNLDWQIVFCEMQEEDVETELISL